MLALLISLVVSQEPAAPEASTDPAPAETAPEAAASPTAGGSGGTGTDPAISALKRQADELARAASKLKDLKPDERLKAAEELRKKASLPGMPVLPPQDYDLGGYFELTEQEQVLVLARSFFEALVGGDAGRVVDYTGLPFFLEDKRIDRPDELRSSWARHLRSKRTDLITLYGVELFTPADFEKRYGAPPARLKGWSWRQSGQYLAVANLSGRAAIVLLKPLGATWQITAYHD